MEQYYTKDFGKILIESLQNSPTSMQDWCGTAKCKLQDSFIFGVLHLTCALMVMKYRHVTHRQTDGLKSYSRVVLCTAVLYRCTI